MRSSCQLIEVPLLYCWWEVQLLTKFCLCQVCRLPPRTAGWAGRATSPWRSSVSRAGVEDSLRPSTSVSTQQHRVSSWVDNLTKIIKFAHRSKSHCLTRICSLLVNYETILGIRLWYKDVRGKPVNFDTRKIRNLQISNISSLSILPLHQLEIFGSEKWAALLPQWVFQEISSWDIFLWNVILLTELWDGQQTRLLRNLTNTERPRFELDNLQSRKRLMIKIYSANKKGK